MTTFRTPLATDVSLEAATRTRGLARDRLKAIDAETVEAIPQTPATLDQAAAIMLLHGTPDQKAEALRYALSTPTSQP